MTSTQFFQNLRIIGTSTPNSDDSLGSQVRRVKKKRAQRENADGQCTRSQSDPCCISRRQLDLPTSMPAPPSCSRGCGAAGGPGGVGERATVGRRRRRGEHRLQLSEALESGTLEQRRGRQRERGTSSGPAVHLGLAMGMGEFWCVESLYW